MGFNLTFSYEQWINHVKTNSEFYQKIKNEAEYIKNKKENTSKKRKKR